MLNGWFYLVLPFLLAILSSLHTIPCLTSPPRHPTFHCFTSSLPLRTYRLCLVRRPGQFVSSKNQKSSQAIMASGTIYATVPAVVAAAGIYFFERNHSKPKVTKRLYIRALCCRSREREREALESPDCPPSPTAESPTPTASVYEWGNF